MRPKQFPLLTWREYEGIVWSLNKEMFQINLKLQTMDDQLSLSREASTLL